MPNNLIRLRPHKCIISLKRYIDISSIFLSTIFIMSLLYHCDDKCLIFVCNCQIFLIGTTYEPSYGSYVSICRKPQEDARKRSPGT